MTPGACHVHGIDSGGPPAGSGSSSIERQPATGPETGEQGRGGGVEARAADAAQQERGEDGVRPGLARSGRHDPRVRDVEVCAQAMGEQPVARAIERGAVGVGRVELALVGDQRREEADARGRLLDPPRERLAVEPAGDDVELGLPGRVVQRAARELAAAHEPVVREGRRRRRGQRRGAARGGAAGRGGCREVIGRRRGRGGRRSGGGRGWSMERPPGCSTDRPPRAPRSRIAAGRGGTGSSPPCRGRSSTAAPSPRGRPGRGSSTACRTTGSRTWRGTGTRARTTSSRQPMRAHVSGGDMPSKAAGSISSASTSMPSTTRGPGARTARSRRRRTRGRPGPPAAPTSPRASASAPTRRSCRRARTRRA